jgi:hypothetical protein
MDQSAFFALQATFYSKTNVCCAHQQSQVVQSATKTAANVHSATTEISSSMKKHNDATVSQLTSSTAANAHYAQTNLSAVAFATPIGVLSAAQIILFTTTKHRIVIVRTVTTSMRQRGNAPCVRRISLVVRTAVRMGPCVKSAMTRENSFWIMRQRNVCARKDFSWKRAYAHFAHQNTQAARNAHSKERNAHNATLTPISFMIPQQNSVPASQLTTFRPIPNANSAAKPSLTVSAAKATLMSSKALPLNASSARKPLN